MSQVGLVQGEVLVGLQAGGDLSQRVGVTLVEALLLPKVLVLQHSSRSLKQQHHQGATGGGRTISLPAHFEFLDLSSEGRVSSNVLEERRLEADP